MNYTHEEDCMQGMDEGGAPEKIENGLSDDASCLTAFRKVPECHKESIEIRKAACIRQSIKKLHRYPSMISPFVSFRITFSSSCPPV